MGTLDILERRVARLEAAKTPPPVRDVRLIFEPYGGDQEAYRRHREQIAAAEGEGAFVIVIGALRAREPACAA